MTKPEVPPGAVRVWDRFVRFFHWTLAGCVLVNFFVLDDGDTLHQWLGYTASALVVARVVWGFVGSRYARFSDFFPTPARLRHHMRQMLARTPDPHVGHNPLGAVMMLALMALVLALGLTGLLQTTDRYWGDEWMQALHEGLANALIALVGLHAGAALVMGRLERINLVKAMVTGIKQRY